MAYTYVVQTTEQKGDLLLLTLAPQTPGEGMAFVAGQYAAIGFQQGNRPTPMRCFSIVSAPSSDTLQFAMRIRGRFTRTAAAVQPGTIVRVQGPFGEFTVDEAYDERLVLLAGGIGITPLMSIMRDVTERHLQIPMTLIFANRSAAAIPFYEEIQELTRRNPLLRVRFYCNDGADNMPDVTHGSVSTADVQQLAGGPFAGSTYFICGPKGFTKTISKQLRTNNVHESRILTESFTQASSVKLGERFTARAFTYGFAAAAMVAGVAFITLLDLNQALPKLARAQTKTTPTTQSTTSDNVNSTTPSTSATTQNTNNITSTVPSQTYYQSPMSSVS